MKNVTQIIIATLKGGRPNGVNHAAKTSGNGMSGPLSKGSGWSGPSSGINAGRKRSFRKSSPLLSGGRCGISFNGRPFISPLVPLLNFFMPAQKLKSKIRVGSKEIKVCDEPRSPSKGLGTVQE
jgi:hypothetical protein